MCKGLTSVTIPNSVTTIDMHAFEDCTSLTSITIGSGIRTIDIRAFSNCPELTDVYCYTESVPNTASDAFEGSYIEYATLHVPAVSVNSYRQTAPWSGFKSVVAIGGDTPTTKKCATPTISYVNGEIIFGCETEGVEYISEIKASDAKKYYEGKIVPTNKYVVSVYAIKTGYDNSDVATMELTISGTGSSITGDVNGDGVVDVKDYIGVANIIHYGSIDGK